MLWSYLTGGSKMPHWPVTNLVVLAAALANFTGCAPHSAEEVVVYTALDEEFSRPIFEEFTRQTGIAVRAKFDVESTKSVALTQAIMAERGRPRCDVFWNNEVVNTLRLYQKRLLDEYQSAAGADYPDQYRSPSGAWYGFAARARVLVVNTNLVGDGRGRDAFATVDADSKGDSPVAKESRPLSPPEGWPRSIYDLTDPTWKNRCGIAKPLAGTTATHAAVLFAAWGDEAAKGFFRAVKANARIMGGNKQVARAVADGELAFGLTDTDDAIIEIESGRPVAIVFPDQDELGRPPSPDGPLGTLMIPNTLAIIRGAPRRAAAERLVEYLLSPEVEERLARGPSAQFPLGRKAQVASRAAPASGVREMQVDFQAAAKKWDAAAEFLRDEFATAE
ncbi:MAG: extracellular solute-binding protein [Pirellulales bacterium]|nr:extracellular solute-binding protein [Pirellulales bacterium]